MKHLIIFLNYCRSRLDNPVYRQFTSIPPSQRRATLLFLAKPLEERELVHEVAELRHKEKGTQSDITFHICSTLDKPNSGDAVVQTLRLIHRIFPAEPYHNYECYCYSLLPNLDRCDERQLRAVWQSLVSINNAQASYTDLKLAQHSYLYHNASQSSLANFLFNIIQADIHPVDYLPIPTLQEQIDNSADTQWPAFFGTFNAIGVTYPEHEVRHYLRRLYVKQLFKCSLPEVNSTPMQKCNAEAQHILNHLPIQPKRLALQEEMLLDIEEHTILWQPAEPFWQQTTQEQISQLHDIPHADWLSKLRQRIEVYYQSRFREMGVEFFFQVESQKTDRYALTMKAIIAEELSLLLQTQPYTPETQKNIVRAVINLLQQRVLEMQKMADDTQSRVHELEQELNDIRRRWEEQSIISRMMRKDTTILHSYSKVLAALFTQKTLLPGCHFAIKLLNELIPSVQELFDSISHARQILDEAIALSENAVQETDPTPALKQFGLSQLQEAEQCITNDSERFINQYLQVVQLFTGQQPVANAEDLIVRVQDRFATHIDEYLDQRIAEGTMPPVLNQPITERMANLYIGKGGLQAFVNTLKEQTGLDLKVKTDTQNNIANEYILVSPTTTEVDDVRHVITDDSSQLLLLHLQQSLRLTDLDGFSGQKMFIEPSLF